MSILIRSAVFTLKSTLARAMLLALGLVCAVGPAHAQFAVIDVASLGQLIAQAQTLLQQLDAVRTQINQAQTLYQSMTGPRGMQQLLNVGGLNYLPTDLRQLSTVEQGNAGLYPKLAASIGDAEIANAVLSPKLLASFSAQEQASINSGRRTVALLQGITDQALSNSSNRFADIQVLMRAIPAASDQKAMLELQAAIATEISVLQNDESKLQILYQVANAQERGNRQMTRELTVMGHGRFQGRFEPLPP